LDEGAVDSHVSPEGLPSSVFIFMFGAALVLAGRALARSSPPVDGYITLAELLVAGYLQERRTMVRHGLVFTAGAMLGLAVLNSWAGLLSAAAAYGLVTFLRFGRRSEESWRNLVPD
jgi:hypothetical protein